ncbi:MAG TPA: threonine--tRNA ligase, partial [Desulfurivibrionaceae bacterium]|nr:threonine--tRNA ligase [Desulfurivibrionaceae bacterium]
MADCTIALSGADKQVVVPEGTPFAEGLKELVSNKLRKQVAAFRANGELYDLSTPVSGDLSVELIMLDSPEGLVILRHSCAHLMAHAVLDLFGPAVKVAIGPATEDGFYYDFDRPEPFTPEDLEKIEARMLQLAGGAHPFVRREVSSAEARALFQSQGQHYKLEILDGLEGQAVTLYELGGFVDLCKGPHLPHCGLLQAYKLTRLAGAYWRGD